MRTFINIRLSNLQIVVWVFIGLFINVAVTRVEASAAPMNVSFQVFYDELTPYGDWVSDPTHGYVWIPYVDAGFQPYQTNGYWVNSRFGNTWVSLYDWGWAPFHYGRWFFTDYYGWAWVPGYEWAPAWVSWRSGRGYYGWAPLWPSVGVHVSVGFPMHHWVFVPRRRFLARNIYNYYVPFNNVSVIYNRTTVINNTYVYNNRTYVAGPSRSELQRVTRSNVPVYEVSNGTRPGRTLVENNRVQIYRPQLESTNQRSNSQTNRPARAYTSEEFSSRRSSASLSRTNETSASPRVVDKSVRRSATVPGNTNPRATASSTSQDRSAVSSSQRGEAVTEVPESRRNVERNNTSLPDSRVSDVRRNAGTVSATREASPSQRQRVETTSPQSSRQEATQNRVLRGDSPATNQRGVDSGQRQVNRPNTIPSQRNVNAGSQPQVRSQAAPNQRQVAAPISRQNNVPNRSNQVNTNQTSRRQSVSPAPRTQVNRPTSTPSRRAATSVGSSGNNYQSRSSVQAPSRQSRSTSGATTNRSNRNTNRRGN